MTEPLTKTWPLFMAKYCLRGRKKKSSETPKIMSRTSKSLKMMILKLNRHKKRIWNFTKVPKQPTQSYFQCLTIHKTNQNWNRKIIANNMVVDNGLDTKKVTTEL
jgi:hypothetical protein